MIGGAVLSYSRGSKETLRRRVPARGAGTHQGRSRRENARQTACHAQADRGKMDYTIQVRRRGGGHGRQRQQTVRLGDEGRRGARPRRERSDQDGGHGQARDREHRVPGALVPQLPVRRSGGAQAETQGQAERREIQTEAQADARAGARRTGRVPGKTPGPAGVQVTRRERSAVVRLLAGRGHRLDHLLRIAGLPKSTYYHHLSRPAHVSRPDVEPMVREIWDGSTSTNGGGTSSNASASASP